MSFPRLSSTGWIFSVEYVPVTWGERHYLIPPKHLVGFCRAVYTGHEPREELHGQYLLQAGMRKKGERAAAGAEGVSALPGTDPVPAKTR
ncbi:MAG: hypothetical protein U0903_13195 [Planctomycetales bacterium]